MASRTWLAVILSLGVWFAYERFFAPKRSTLPETAPVAGSPTTGTPAVATISGSGPFAVPPVIAEDYWFRSDSIEVAFSDVGGKIATVRLPHYKESIRKGETQAVTLVSPSLSPFALSTIFTNPELAALQNAKYDRKVDGNTVTYSASLPGKATVRKTYQIDPTTFQIATQFVISAPGVKQNLGEVYVPVGGKGLSYDVNQPLKSWEVVVYQNDSVKRHHVDSLSEGEEVSKGNTSWLAFGNRYFSSVVINDSALNPDAVLVKFPEFSGGYLRYPFFVKEGTQELVLKTKIFAGPKDFHLLSRTVGLKRLIDYGMFSVLAYPLLDLLNFFHRYVGNYGIAIILLTILVRLLFYPLSLKSFRSMKEMQVLQPRLQELKAKYGDDRERFQREQMALFKAHKVNPFGGCLPILVQIPVFIALYAVLGNSIELFQAPFFGWIQDLSSKDPFYVLPILMGVAMLVQQKITPAVGMDPTQQKIMMAMPVVFTFMMLSLPSGLTLYMFVSTLLGIIQQYVISRSNKVPLKTAGATVGS